jgi:hypothetical protein
MPPQQVERFRADLRLRDGGLEVARQTFVRLPLSESDLQNSASLAHAEPPPGARHLAGMQKVDLKS